MPLRPACPDSYAGHSDPWESRGRDFPRGDPWDRGRYNPLESGSGQAAMSNGNTNAWGGYRGVQFASFRSRSHGPNRDRDRGMPLTWKAIEWGEQEIIPIVKNFLQEHPDVNARTEEDCEKIRVENGICVVKDSGRAVPKPVICFEETPFPDWACSVLRQSKFQEPTPIQMQAWPIALAGHDLVGIAACGSGKTLAYVVPMLVHIQAQHELRPGEGPIGLIMAPSRELCAQIANQVEHFTTHTGILCQTLHGGCDWDESASRLSEDGPRCDVLTATPKRLITCLDRRVTNLKRATYVVLDEADLLLTEGFGPQIRMLQTQLRPDRQALLFSATWPMIVEHLANEIITQEPIHINIGSTKLSACSHIKQKFTQPQQGKTKLDQLRQALSEIRQSIEDGAKVLIFCNERNTVPKLVNQLQSEFPVRGFRGDMSDRDEVLESFAQTSEWPILVCTQILGRGHDFNNLRYVINFDLPHQMVEYVHRIGRTGRAGTEGRSLTMLDEVDLRHAKKLVDILQASGQAVPHWLQVAKRESRKYWSLWHDVRSGMSNPFQEGRNEAGDAFAGDASLENCSGWNGRGAGRRHLWLPRSILRTFPCHEVTQNSFPVSITKAPPTKA